MAMPRLSRTELVDRRILILYRVSADALGQLCPAAARPRSSCCAVAGIVFRRRTVRAWLVPARCGTSQCATHFMRLPDDLRADVCPGIIPLRHDSSSRWQTWGAASGGRHHARFQVVDRLDSLELVGDSDDRQMHLALKARVARELPGGSMFRSVSQVAGYLAADLARLGLVTAARSVGSGDVWRHLRLEPLDVMQLESSFFDRWRQSHPEWVEHDSAFLLREEQLGWSQEGTFCCHMVPA